MDKGQLKDFVDRQLERGMSIGDVREHLRGQGWDDATITSVTGDSSPASASAVPHTPPGRAARRKGWRKTGLAALFFFIALASIAGFQAWSQYALAKEVREKLRYVGISGSAAASLATLSADGRQQGAETSAFAVLNLKGTVDSSDLERPRADFIAEADPAGDVAAAVQRITLETDAQALGASLLSLSATGKFVGGIGARLIDNDVYLRFARPPLAPGGQGNLASAFAEALIGPNLLSNAWLRVPTGAEFAARSGSGASREKDFFWALMLRPDSRIFGHSEELKFLGKRRGDDIDGVATEIHSYAIDGAWMTRQMSELLGRTELEKPVALMAAVQEMIAGKSSQDGAVRADAVEISDGEMEVWVGRHDTLPRRVRANFKIREGSRAPAQLQVRTELDFSYGKPVQIETPSPSMSLEDLERQLGTIKSFTDLF